jgi:hypothetical protein
MNSIIEQIRNQKQGNEEIELEVDNFICKDWNVYYNLYNPENFYDPENHPEWYNPSDVYQFYEKPFVTAEKITIYSADKIQNLQVLIDLIENAAEIENKLLNAIVNFTFGNGNPYLDPKHYEYAKRTMELLHKVEFTNEEFIKRNLRIDTIQFGDNDDELLLHFKCSWDEEHGLIICLKNNEIMSFE